MTHKLTLLRCAGLLLLAGGTASLLSAGSHCPSRRCHRGATGGPRAVAGPDTRTDRSTTPTLDVPLAPWRLTLMGEGVHRLLASLQARPVDRPGDMLQPMAGVYTFQLGAPDQVRSLYPDASWLPSYYASKYPDISTTVETFTKQSLMRDGIIYLSVTYDAATGYLTIKTPVPSGPAAAYATRLPAFLQIAQAAQGGVAQCQATSGCWDPHPGYAPWAMFLPVGLPIVNNLAVTFLDYPPSTSLSQGDYLNNFTMNRWSQVMQDVGIANPFLYETTVDSRPIAAPGSGQTNYLPDATTYFNTPGDNYYLTPLTALLSQPPSNRTSTTTRPVTVLGSPAQKAWSQIIGAQVTTLAVGQTTLPGASLPTPWVAGNHPDVTSYQCCPGDKNSNCSSPTYGNSWDLVADEQIDFQVLCITQLLAENPGMAPSAAKASCYQQWGQPMGSLSTANQHTLCVQAKQDYEYKAPGHCASVEDAEAFCSYYNNNPCPSGVYTCTVPSR